MIGVHATLTAFAALTDLGVTPAFTRELARLSVDEAGLSRLRSFVRSLEVVYWALAMLVTVVAALFLAGPVADWLRPGSFDRAEVIIILDLMFVQIGLQLAVGFYTGGLLGLQRHVSMNLITIITMTLRLAGAAFVVAFVSPTLEALFIWMIAATLLQAGALAVALQSSLPAGVARFDFRHVQSIWRYATGVTFVVVLSLLLMQIDKIVLSRILPLAEFGLYALATNLAISLCKPVGPLARTLLPAMTQLATRGEEQALGRLYRQGTQLATVVVVPVTALVALFSREIVEIAFPQADAAKLAPLVTILAVGYAGNALMSMPYMLTLAYGWVQFAGYQNLIACVVMVPLTIYLTTSYGAIGGAVAWLTVTAGYVLISLYFLHSRLLPAEYRPWYLGNLIPATLVALACGWALREVVPFGQNWLANLFTLVAIYAILLAATAMPLALVRSRIMTMLGFARST